jgi:hypothetical protein
MIYRLVVTIPSEIYIEVDSLADAETFISWVSSRYDSVAYPIASSVNNNERSGIAEVKCLSIEPARADDKITPRNSPSEAFAESIKSQCFATDQPINTPETSTEDDDGPSVA